MKTLILMLCSMLVGFLAGLMVEYKNPEVGKTVTDEIDKLKK
jgi:hypothetical protein